MAVTIHPERPQDLVQLVQDLRLLDGSGNPYGVRRAVHGSGAIVSEDLALAWLTLTRGSDPRFLQSLLRQDPALFDLVGRRAPDWALQELAAVEKAAEDETAIDDRSHQEVRVVLEVPARRAPKSDWEEWAIESGLVSAEQGAEMTKSQLQELAGPPNEAAPKETEEG